MRATHLFASIPSNRTTRELLEWFLAKRYLNEDVFTARLRSYKTTAFVVFFFWSFLNFVTGLIYSYLVTSVSCVLIVFVGWLIDRGRVKSAYVLLLACFNASLIMLACVEGLRSGIYLYFFPCIISFSFLADQTNPTNTLMTYAVCLGSFFIGIFIAPEINGVQKMSDAVYSLSFKLNLANSFLLLVWMSFSLAKENYRKLSMLKDKEVFLNAIFNTSLHSEIIVDMKNGEISEYNTHTTELFGFHGKSLTGVPASSLFYELTAEEGDALYRKMHSADANWEGELTCVRTDGSVFPGSVRIASFLYHGRDYKKITVVDITERKIMLDELRVAKEKAEESVQVKTQFLSNMSHELRTPLNGIIGATNLILQDKHLPHQQEQLNILKFSSEHMLSLINDILDLSKLEANKVNLERIPLDLSKFVHTTAAVFKQQFADKGLSLDVTIDPGFTRSVLADPTRLNQVLTNLLSNALKFTSAGGVTIEVKALSIRSDFNRIEFSVADTGIGIPEEKRVRIFDQFTQADDKTTRKYGGTGLGLTISQKLVSLMGGELKVESKYGKGSRFHFTITFPVHHGKEKVYVNNNSKIDNGRLKGLKVLIAEDNPINMMIASKFLDKWGVIHTKAKNGLEAVAAFNADKFDVILMDLEMPEMDGYGALQEIRSTNKEIPAIAFTAAVFENMRDKLSACGFSDYIQKPFQPEDLHARLVKFSGDFSSSS
ncbi:MAG: response regulator [Chitinophagaceae bacterium]|nr:response regulator [Chitinophagaceae bacterium]